MKITISKKIGCIVLSALMTASVLLSNLVDIIPDAVNTVHADTVHTDHEGEDKDGSCHVGWKGVSSLPTEPGNYYLTTDVTISSTWSVPEGTTNLCLNGHDIIKSSNGSAIYINSGAILNLYNESKNSGTISHSKDSNNIPIEGLGVYVEGGTFNMYGGSISGNKTIFSGGGIYLNFGEVTITGGEIYGNEAHHGGGVCVEYGTATISGGEISSNKATGEYGQGGGVYVYKGTVIFSDATISENESVSSGGGVLVQDGTVTFSGGEISNNKVTGEYGNGGGVSVYDGTVTFSGSTISDNTANYGGGLSVLSGNVELSGGTISGNTANNGSGGGVYIVLPGTFTMTGGTIVNNIAIDKENVGRGCGGGVYSNGTFNMSGGTITENKADTDGDNVYIIDDYASINPGEDAVIDGGLYSEDYTTVCFYSNVNGDDTDKMTSQIIKKGEDVKLNANPFTREDYVFIAWNTKPDRSGTNYADCEPINVEKTDYEGLTLYAVWDKPHEEHDKQDTAGSLHNGWTEWTKEDELPKNPGSYYLMTDVTLSATWKVQPGTTNLCLNGHSITAAGEFDTITVGAYATLNLYDESNNSGIITHSENCEGRGVHVNGTFNMHSGKITGNKFIHNTFSSGAGVVVDGGILTISGGEISGNSTNVSGGGICVDRGTATISGGKITGNSSKTSGGGVRVSSKAVVIISGGEISDNTTKGDGGGISVVGSGTVTLTGGTIINNKALGQENYGYGGGVFIKFGTFNMSGGTVTGNTAATDGNNVYINDEYGTFIPGEDAVIDGGLYSEDYTTVCFYSNVNGDDTDKMTSQIIKKGEAVNLNPNVFSREGYDFNGWNTKADGSGEVYADGANVYIFKQVYDDLKLYAQWAKLHEDHDKQDDDKCSLHEGWTAWTKDNELPSEPGYYYLATDIALSDTWSAPPGATNLCLNGYKIVQTKVDSATIYVSSDASLNLYDVKNYSGIITHEKDANDEPKKGIGVYVSGGTFTMTGGEISGNTGGSYGGGVYVYDGTFTMTGGEISGNASDSGGGGVYVDSNSTLTMNGGEISGNSAKEQGGGVYVDYNSALTMNGGEIANNKATGENGFGGGVYCIGTFNMSNGTITGNTATEDGNNVFIILGETFNPDPIDDPTIDGGLVSKSYTTVCFFANGGGGEMRSQIIPKNTDTALRKNTFTLKDCVLKEWNTKADGSGESYADEDKVNVSSDEGLILYAQWVPDKYKITFVDGDGTTLQSSDVAYNTVPKYTGTKTPTKAPDAEYSYTFAGWTDGTKEYGLTEDLPAAKAVVTYRPVFSSAVNEYEVMFVNEDGTELQSGQVAYGEVPEYKGTTPAKAPDAQYTYTFTGWKNGDSEYDKDAALPKVTGDVTYTAVYTGTLNQYTITFVDDDGAVLSSEKYDYGTAAAAIVKPTDPSKKADAQYTYKFSGWTPVIAEVTGDATYTATYLTTTNKYTITFVDGDGNKTSKQYDYGTPADDIVVPTNVTKTATAQYTYTFEKWDKEIADVTEDATYTAQFTATVNEYTITFVSDGKVVSTKDYPYGTSADDIKPADPTIAPTAQYTYTFVGWTPALAEVTGEATYTAQFSTKVNNYNVTFVDEDGTVISSADYDYGTVASAITKPADPTKAPTAQFTYTFSGWTPEIANVTADATYTATYKAAVNEYTIKFVDEDGTVLQSSKVAYGETPSFTGTTPTKKATAQYTYTFSGWTPEIANVTADATYTATYKAAVNEYTVTFISDGKVISTKDYPYGTAAADITVPADPTIAPTAQYTYTFEGWSPALEEVTGDAAYTAVYTSTINAYTVTFLDEDGTVLSSKVYDYGTKAADIVRPADPSKAATAQYTYTFEGWDAEIVDVTADAVYTAVYTSTVNEYTVTFISDGKVISTKDYPYGTAAADIVVPADPTIAPTVQYTYTFEGWTPAIADVTGDATYTAEFSATVNEYEIKFVDEDGTVLQSVKVAYGQNPSYTGETPTKESTDESTFAFVGWTDGTVTYSTSATLPKVTGDAVYTAVYADTQKEYEIKFTDDEGNVLQTIMVLYGQVPVYQGKDPSKEATEQYTYTFIGWNDGKNTYGVSDKLPAVIGDAVYKAVFESTVNEYTITFVNSDGTVLQTSKVPYGELPSYTRATPVKAEDEMYTYAFSGWTPELVKVTGDATYTAVFTANAKPASYYLKSLTGDGLGGDIVAVFGRTIDDAHAIDYLDRVESDGKALTRDKDYTAESGSVIITLKKEYLDTLSEGKHALTVYFKDGQSVSLEYTVKHISNEAENIPSTGKKIAKTLFIGGACVLLAAAVAGTAIVIKKKRKKEDA